MFHRGNSRATHIIFDRATCTRAITAVHQRLAGLHATPEIRTFQLTCRLDFLGRGRSRSNSDHFLWLGLPPIPCGERQSMVFWVRLLYHHGWPLLTAGRGKLRILR